MVNIPGAKCILLEKWPIQQLPRFRNVCYKCILNINWEHMKLGVQTTKRTTNGECKPVKGIKLILSHCLLWHFSHFIQNSGCA